MNKQSENAVKSINEETPGYNKTNRNRIKVEIESKEELDEDEENYAVIPPNGGWGWMVVACAFYCNVVVDGIQLTFGVFLKSISETFKAEYSSVALAGSLMFGVHLLMGPICAGCSTMFGLRPVTIAGSLICCFGVAITYFANCYWYLYISYGLVGGMGLGLVYMNSLVIISLYFTTLLPIAIAIVVCGTGVGTMVFAILGDSLLRVTTWQNSFLMQAALAGSMALAAISFKPLKPIKVKLSEARLSKASNPIVESDPRTARRGAVFIKRDINPRQSVLSIKTIQSLALSSLLEEYVVSEVKRKNFYDSICCKCCRRKSKESKSQDFLILVENKAETSQNRKRSYLEKKRSSLQSEKEISSVLTSSSHATIFTKVEYQEKPENKSCEVLKKTIWAMVDFQLLKSCAFFLFTISGALQLASLLMVFIYEKDRCAELGFSEDMSTYFVVTLGGANMLWRLLLGGLATIPKINYRALAISCTVIGGLATMFSGFSSSIYYQFAFCIFFGLGMASFAVFRLVYLIDLVGVDLVGNGTGINLLFMGVFCIAFPPFFGWTMEMTKSYNIIFLITGLFMVAAGLMLINLHKLREKELKRSRKS